MPRKRRTPQTRPPEDRDFDMLTTDLGLQGRWTDKATGKAVLRYDVTLEYADPRTVQVGVDIDRPTLDERIEHRVARMFELGFVAEVERLLADGLDEGRTAATAIGYREVTMHLRGELTLDEARERTVVATRRFARRQDSWFRKDPRITWLRYDDPELVDKARAVVPG